MSRLIRFHGFGDAEQLRCDDVPTPRPGPGEVLIATQAIGLSWNDVLWRQNLSLCPVAPSLPCGLGGELAGVVEAVGEGVDDLDVGSAVASFLCESPNHYPAYGDHVLMPRQALTVYPSQLSAVEASVHYSALLSGYLALVERAGLQPGQWLLITESDACDGPLLVQLASLLGARVIACISCPGARPLIEGLGASKVIVCAEEDVVQQVQRFTHGHGVDVILDAMCGSQLGLLGDLAAPLGKLVLYGMNGGNLGVFPACAAFRKHLQFFRHSLLDYTGNRDLGIAPQTEQVRQALARLNQWTEEGRLTPLIEQVFPFESFAEAHRYLEGGRFPGRIVLQL